MNADISNDAQLSRISEKVIGCAFAVSNGLGVGFLEKVYENALAHELRKAGLVIRQQHSVEVRYDGMIVGDYIADIVVEDLVIVELKHARILDEMHVAQCLNYLCATGVRLWLLINFGKPRIEVRRLAL
jgi:GxxExxY protein